jgi:hypothetical protein
VGNTSKIIETKFKMALQMESLSAQIEVLTTSRALSSERVLYIKSSKTVPEKELNILT